MAERLIIDDTSVYEIDEECLRQRNSAEGDQEQRTVEHKYEKYMGKSYDKYQKNKLTKK